MKVRELMTPNPSSADPETTVEEIATLMKEEDVGCIPILDEDGKVAGVITDRDIVVRCIAEGQDPSECRADDIISPQSVTISPDAEANEAARIMAERQIRRLPVVEDDQLVGMLSLGDVAVKAHDDRMSGSVLEDVSEGVKSGSRGRQIGAQQGGSRSGVKTATANRTDARRSSSGKTTGAQQNFARQKQSSGMPPGRQNARAETAANKDRRKGRGDDARLSSSFEEAGITNRRRSEEAANQEKVLPFREKGDYRVRAESKRTRQAVEKRGSGRGPRKTG
ncbi:MAG TPA: CBS domain-containing protein [Terriglobales bacterium]|nr:CBS domain-containing protein [Terriglobales bacterium]